MIKLLNYSGKMFEYWQMVKILNKNILHKIDTQHCRWEWMIFMEHQQANKCKTLAYALDRQMETRSLLQDGQSERSSTQVCPQLWYFRVIL